MQKREKGKKIKVILKKVCIAEKQKKSCASTVFTIQKKKEKHVRQRGFPKNSESTQESERLKKRKKTDMKKKHE